MQTGSRKIRRPDMVRKKRINQNEIKRATFIHAYSQKSNP